MMPHSDSQDHCDPPLFSYVFQCASTECKIYQLHPKIFVTQSFTGNNCYVFECFFSSIVTRERLSEQLLCEIVVH
jgi:hypothetical protein